MSNIAPHHCHWPGCSKAVPPKMWGCSQHWFKLPQDIRNSIWRAYTPGQEITKRPSPEYMQAALHAQEWIKNHEMQMSKSRELIENAA